MCIFFLTHNYAVFQNIYMVFTEHFIPCQDGNFLQVLIFSTICDTVAFAPSLQVISTSTAAALPLLLPLAPTSSLQQTGRFEEADQQRTNHKAQLQGE